MHEHLLKLACRMSDPVRFSLSSWHLVCIAVLTQNPCSMHAQVSDPELEGQEGMESGAELSFEEGNLLSYSRLCLLSCDAQPSGTAGCCFRDMQSNVVVRPC